MMSLCFFRHVLSATRRACRAARSLLRVSTVVGTTIQLNSSINTSGYLFTLEYTHNLGGEIVRVKFPRLFGDTFPAGCRSALLNLCIPILKMYPKRVSLALSVARLLRTDNI